MTSNLKILDCTFRDGGYYNNWDFDKNIVRKYINSMSTSGVDYVEIGFRNFSQNNFMGPFAYSTDSFIEGLPNISKINVGVMSDASIFLTDNKKVSDLVRELYRNKADSIISLVRIATHFKDVERSQEITKTLKELGYIVALNLMQTGGRKSSEIEDIVKSIAKDDTVDTLYFADSLGNMNNEEIINVIDSIKTFWKKDIGIHTHNNQGQALSNSMTALENGVTWLDSTVRGMGRGAGNSTTEDLMRLINKKMNDTNYSPQELYEICLNDFDILQKKYNWGQNLYYALAADFDIHPTYVQEMLSDNRYSRLDILDIINNLKDVPTKSYNKEILETIKYKDAKDCHGEWNANGWCSNRDVLIIGNGPSSLTYYDDIIKYINQYKPLVLSLNIQKKYPEDIVDGFVCANLSRATLESKFYENIHKPIYAPQSIFLENPNLSNMFENIKDYGMALKNSEIQIENTGCILPYPLTAIYAFALASIGKANNIFLVGFDGYGSSDFRQQEMINAIDLYKESPLSLDLISLTPTTYPVIKNSIYAPK